MSEKTEQRLDTELSALQKERLKLVGRNLSKRQVEQLRGIDKRITEITTQLTTDTRASIERLASLSDCEKIDLALEEGKKRRLIDVQDFGDPSAEKCCVLIGSSHYPHTSVKLRDDPISRNMKRSQFELFAALHLLKEFDVHSRLIVEGFQKGNVINTNVSITLPGSHTISMQSEEAQQYFLKHPDHFMQMQGDMHVAGKHTVFYELSNYAHIEGAHSPEVSLELDRIYGLQLIENEFLRKYKPNIGLDG